MFQEPGIIIAPGAYDTWSARLIEKAGFSALYMTGYGVSASVLGKPDIGLLTMSEMVAQAKNIVSTVDIPLIADGDNGYGGTLNVIRTVQEYEQVGVAAIQLEDQVFPKRCGHMEGKQLISKDEMISKIKAAVYARQLEDFVIIARSDARAVNGFEDALDRVKDYVEAGADVIFFEAPESEDEMKKVSEIIKVPLLANMVENGKTPFLKERKLAEMGYKIAIYPVSTLYTVTKAILGLLEALKKDGTTLTYLDHMVDFSTFNEMIGVKEARDLEKIFLK